MKKLFMLSLLVSVPAFAMDTSIKSDREQTQVIYYTENYKKKMAFDALRRQKKRLDEQTAQMVSDAEQAEQNIEAYIQEVGLARKAELQRWDSPYSFQKVNREQHIYDTQYYHTLYIYGKRQFLCWSARELIPFDQQHMKSFLEKLPYVISVTTSDEHKQQERENQRKQQKEREAQNAISIKKDLRILRGPQDGSNSQPNSSSSSSFSSSSSNSD